MPSNSKEYARKYMASYYWRHREKILARRKELEYSRTISTSWIRHARKLKDAAIAAYGGYLCVCCGETEKKFLTIDHIVPVGTKNRLVGTQFYRWLRDQQYPQGYRVLCLNCNMERHLNGGECPHVAAKQVEELSTEVQISFC